MATENSLNNINLGSINLTCDICNASTIIETKQGYVCRSCGIVLEMQILEYHRPYTIEKVQHEILSTTKIGSKKERLNNPNSYRLEKLNQIQKIKSNDEQMNQIAKIEISSILASLDISSGIKESIYKIYLKIRKGLPSGTKFRNPQKLIPLVIYYYLKLNTIPLDEERLLEVSKITKKEYNSFKSQILSFLPKYKQRNRRKFVLNRILGIIEHYKLEMSFYNQSKVILSKLWDSIKNTKDDVIAGLIASIVALCHYKDIITVNTICSFLNIRMSTIQSQVKERIFKRYNIQGFKSLVRSSDILRRVIDKLCNITKQNNIKPKNKDFSEKEENSLKNIDLIQIELGTAIPVFNPQNNKDFYILAVKDEIILEPTFISIKVPIERESNQLEKTYSEKVHNHIELEFLKYYNEKGPPIFTLI